MSSITVKVKVASASENNTLEFAMNLEDTVAALKLRVFEATERRPEAQRLIYKGKLLKDTDTFGALGVEDGHAIHLAPPTAAVQDTIRMPSSILSQESRMSSIAPQLARFDMAMLTLLSNEDTRAIESVKILTMIIENIQNNPLEEKYRSIRKRTLGSATGGGEVISALGFDETQSEWVLIPSADKWEVLVAAKRKLDALQARMQRGPASLPQARPLVSSSTEARRFPAAAPPTGFGAIPTSLHAASDPEYAQVFQQLLLGFQNLRTSGETDSASAAPTTQNSQNQGDDQPKDDTKH